MTSFTIAPMQDSDWPSVRQIYAEGLATGNATFETAVPTWESWTQSKRPDCRLVAKQPNGQIIGWAALSPTSKRAVYAGVAEVSVYVGAAGRGQGIGKALLQALVHASEEAGVWTLQASIFPENEASVSIHQQCGFRLMGRRERIAQLHGQWRDTVILERRSKITGQ